MINIVKEQKGDVLVVKLSGSIEESVDFDKLIGPAPKEILVSTKAVPRINSVGVKAWIKYFQGLNAKKTKITFTECSMAIVEQINLISNFTCGGTVNSLYVPYLCQNCGAESAAPYTVEQVKKLEFKMPDAKCPKCGGKASFDDLPDEYFYFLMNG